MQAASSDGSTQTQVFNITINDLDEFDVSVPTDTDAATNEVDENVVIGTTVGITADDLVAGLYGLAAGWILTGIL